MSAWAWVLVGAVLIPAIGFGAAWFASGTPGLRRSETEIVRLADGIVDIRFPGGRGTATPVVTDERGQCYEVVLRPRGRAPIVVYCAPALVPLRSTVRKALEVAP